MPRDSQLYSPMSQALLRAARMGQVKRPSPSPQEDEKEPADDEDAEGEVDSAFVAPRWAQVPKHLEEPEPQYLAKRRKGLPPVYNGTAGPSASAPQLRKTKIKKIDTHGNASVWEVLVPGGQLVEGEVVEGTSPTEAPAPGTVVEGLGVVNADGVVVAEEPRPPPPQRRRPPPPKRKAKGPGRGRKKRPSGSTSAGALNAANSANTPSASVDADGQRHHPASNADLEMADGSAHEGDEGSDDEDEGEEDDELGRDEAEHSQSPRTDTKSPSKHPDTNAPLAADQHKGLRSPIREAHGARSNSNASSPGVPLAAEHHHQPPIIKIDPAEEVPPAPNASAEQISVADISSIKPHLQNDTVPTSVAITAELPGIHNPLDGLSEPQAQTPSSSRGILHIEEPPEHAPGHQPEVEQLPTPEGMPHREQQHA